MIVVIYIFSTIGFHHYEGYFYDENRMYPTDLIGGFMYKDICRNSFWCLWNFINYGLRFGGGIGDVSLKMNKTHVIQTLSHPTILASSFDFYAFSQLPYHPRFPSVSLFFLGYG